MIAWRWRYELALVSGLAAGLAAAVNSIGTLPTVIAMVVTTLAIPCWPITRRFTLDRAWWIITPHRVRAGCTQGLIYSSRGKIPAIVWTTHQAFGERVLLWCRAGTSVDDFVSARAVLTAACWAQDVHVFVDPQHTHLVVLDVIRRSIDVIGDIEGARSSDPSTDHLPGPTIK